METRKEKDAKMGQGGEKEHTRKLFVFIATVKRPTSFVNELDLWPAPKRHEGTVVR
jgi:hypothetical protein